MDFVKKISIKLFFLVLVIAFGCSKEDPKPSLVGTWQLTRVISGGCTDTANDGKATCTNNCNAVITATTLVFPPILGDPTVYNYRASTGTLTLTPPSGPTATFSYELTAGTLIVAYENPGDGCTDTYYFNKAK
jgi:hypothetical protein